MATYNSPWHARAANSTGFGWTTVDYSAIDATVYGAAAHIDTAQNTAGSIFVDDSPNQTGFIDNSPDTRANYDWISTAITLPSGAVLISAEMDFLNVAAGSEDRGLLLGFGISNAANPATATRYSGVYAVLDTTASQRGSWGINNWGQLGGWNQSSTAHRILRATWQLSADKLQLNGHYGYFLNADRKLAAGGQVILDTSTLQAFDVSAGAWLWVVAGTRNSAAGAVVYELAVPLRYSILEVTS